MSLARAKSKEDKQQKHQAIINSAEQLFEQTQSLPTVATIAKNSGQAKGTVYLYFSSKEAIYLSLLMKHYAAWFEDIKQALTNTEGLGQLLTAFLAYPLSQQTFLNLANLSSPLLEPGTDEELLNQYYEHINQHSSDIASGISRLFPVLTPQQSASLVSDSHALVLGLWQQRQRQPNLIFETSAKAALARLWKGYFSQ